MSSEHPVMRLIGPNAIDRSGSRRKPTRQKRPRYKRKADTEQVDLPDPDGSGRRVQVTRNRRVDILALEYSRRRLTRDGRDIGRVLQRVCVDRVTGFPNQWEPRVDSSPAPDDCVIHQLDAARILGILKDWLVRRIGISEAGALRKILGEGWSYAQIAHSRGLSGGVATHRVANWFVGCLEELAVAYRANPPFESEVAHPEPSHSSTKGIDRSSWGQN